MEAAGRQALNMKTLHCDISTALFAPHYLLFASFLLVIIHEHEEGEDNEAEERHTDRHEFMIR